MITMGLNAVLLHWTCLDHDFISYCQNEDIKVYTYTHKDDEELEYMYRYRVDGIITNGFLKRLAIALAPVLAAF